jgi:hypothetical protein
MRGSTSAAAVPTTVARADEAAAMIRLWTSASLTKRLPAAVAYHCSEKPWKSLALCPALKLNTTMTAIGA